MTENIKTDQLSNLRRGQSAIYLAGGCFWGVEAYMDKIKGVIESNVGYANGHASSPTYEDVCKYDTGYAETVFIKYDTKVVSLETILKQFFRIIDPTTLNRQGNDVGQQYRTGIYCIDESQLEEVKAFVVNEQSNYQKPIVVEQELIDNYYLAEIYHQKYLEKNPHGYCHIDLSSFEEI